MDTITVYWPGKFNDHPVLINASAFDPALHRRLEDGPPPAADVETPPPEKPKGRK